MTEVLKVTDLTVAFKNEKNEKVILDGITFHVKKGEILAIVGESGCGKSASLLSVMGLLPSNARICSGKVSLLGQDLTELDQKELDRIRGSRMSMVFQDALTSLNPLFTIGNQMTETIKKHTDLDSKAAKERARGLLEKVGLPDAEAALKKYPHTLSGGMRQRVMIAMALCCSPDLLIADEPTTALDVTIQAQIMDMLKEIQKETGMALILITHDMGIVAEMADRVMVMYAGQFIEEANLFSLFESPKHPYTKALLQSIPGRMKDREQELFSINGTVPQEYDKLEGCRFYNRCPFQIEECKEKQQLQSFDKEHYVRCFRAAEIGS